MSAISTSFSLNRLAQELAVTDCVIPTPDDAKSDAASGSEAPGDLDCQSFSTDTRSLKPGDVYIALRGPNHDGHAYTGAAIEAGASALILEYKVESSIPQLIVTDTRLALGQLAELWLSVSNARKFAVTGSNGKTTVKEMLASILAADNQSVLATRGNFNNDIGLPLTALRVQPGHDAVVLEMGMNSDGEIAYLADIAKADISLVTNVSAAHLAGFGSIEKIAAEKSSIFTKAPDGGFAVVPLDDAFLPLMREKAAHLNVRTFGFTDGADIRGDFIAGSLSVACSDSVGGALAGATFAIKLDLLGRHNRSNALAAIAAASCAGVGQDAIQKGLSSLKAVPGRMQIRDLGFEARIIDDSYNANPASAKAAIDVLAECEGVRTLVLGDMLELGSDQLELHADVGRYAKACGIDCLLTIGSCAAIAASEFGANAKSFSDKEQLASVLGKKLGSAHTILFKGSRGARMEDVIDLMIGDVQPVGTGAGQQPSGHLQRAVSL